MDEDIYLMPCNIQMVIILTTHFLTLDTCRPCDLLLWGGISAGCCSERGDEKSYFISVLSEDRSDLVVTSGPRNRRVPGSKPDSTKETPCKRAWWTPNPSGQMLSHWCGAEAWRGGVVLVI
ncbi:hypothetical protein AVEN_123149-1 [Araneus ventricosus]|uniref:Uncharacterized protein n=1 Tax=Araneus ventricosus TaxID=182803 RepID=A0A4Y2UB55_ARAVE|nr:hypothetical protein AVEN_123149-1 [Araneus ventricosus]